ncbi:phage tail protein [Sphingobacterium luzhongxinii]|uniref:phage tail protein n=1 Tax=Sphingobacterium luzhongxinii TaxID=2654181 RepID=UPI0013DC2B34|nr:phage tail protein [Sphingobacterium sp. xlx-73]
MTIQVYRGAVPTIELPLELAVFTDEKQGVHELVFTLDVSSALDIEIGDTVTYNGEVMKVNFTPTYTNKGTALRSYVLTFEGRRATLYEQPLVDEGDVTFSYFGDASDLLSLILSNINQLDAGWTAGEVDVVEPLAFEFDNVSCLAALDAVAEAFGLEWKIKQRVITLKKNVGVYREVVLSQGRSNGLYSLAREYLRDTGIVTRAYALGSAQNLPAEYGGKRLGLPDYIEANVDKYGVKVRYYTFDSVFPRRTGTATAVAKISDKTYTLTDASLDFDINGQRAGENDVKIVFKSGALNGQEFVVTKYDHATKTITYKANESSNGLLIPFSVTVAEVGDKYTLVGLIMPSTYIDAAKAELVAKRAEALAADSVPKVVYSLDSDVLFLKNNGLLLEAGDIVRVQDSDIGLDELLTIQRVSYPAIFPQVLVPGMQFTAEVGNTSYAKLQDKVWKDVQEQKVVSGQIRRASVELARVNAARMRELQGYIFDADDYFDTDRIKPQSIETQMLSVGAKSQNFYLSGVTMQPNFTGDANKFHVSGGQLQHREISIAAGFIWVLNAQAFQALDPAKVYYLSAKCNKTQLIGTYNLTEQPYKVEDQEGFFNFNIGVLYPVGTDGKRFFANTSGVTYVVGSQITTGRIKSLDGNTWFDLDTGEIRGAITFTSGQSVQDAIDQAKGEAVAQSGVATQQAIANLSVGGRNYAINSAINSLGDYFNYQNINYFNIENGNELRVKGGNAGCFYTPNLAKSIGLSETVTISYWVKNNAATQNQISVTLNGNAGFGYETLVPDQGWTRIVKTGIVSGSTNNPLSILLFENYNAGSFDLSFKEIQVEIGDKVTDWKIAVEDLEKQIIDTDDARKVYIDAQDNLKEIQTKAYADNIVSIEESRAILDATNKANAAKTYADAQDILLKAQTDAYADGKVTTEEQARIQQAQTNLQAAKAYAEAQDNLSKIESKAYADGIVDAEEQRAIYDAQTKLNEAKGYAYNQALQAETNAIAASNVNTQLAIANLSVGGRNYAINSAINSLGDYFNYQNINYFNIENGNELRVKGGNAGYFYTPNLAKSIGLSETVTISYWVKNNAATQNQISVTLNGNAGFGYETLVPDQGWTRIVKTGIVSGSTNNPLSILLFENYNAGSFDLSFKEIQVEIGDKVTDWKIAVEDLQKQIIDTDDARKTYIDAQDSLKEIQTKAYADSIVSIEEARAIQDATNKANAAKTYADAQDSLLKAQTDAYADGKITAEEQARILQAQANLQSAKDYAKAQDDLMTVGGRNYAISSAINSVNGYSIVNNITSLIIENNNELRVSGGNNGYLYSPVLSVGIPLHTEVTVSYMIKNNVSTTNQVTFSFNGNGGMTPVLLQPNQDWTRIVQTVIVSGLTTTPLYRVMLENYNAGSFDISLKEIQIEIGNKVTDWTPAPEDVDQKIVESVTPLQALINELKTKTGIDALPSGKTIVNGGQVDTDLLNAIAVRALIMSVGLLTASEIDTTSLFAQYIEANNLKLTGSSRIGDWNLDVTPYGFTELGDDVVIQSGNYLFNYWFYLTVNYLKFYATRVNVNDSFPNPTNYFAKIGTENYTDPYVHIKAPGIALHIESGSVKVGNNFGLTQKQAISTPSGTRYLNIENGFITSITTS